MLSRNMKTCKKGPSLTKLEAKKHLKVVLNPELHKKYKCKLCKMYHVKPIWNKDWVQS